MLYIFDKDGTICRSKSGKKFINSVEDQELIPGVLDKINQLEADGHKIAIASNQGGVAFGFMTYGQASDIVRNASDLIKAEYCIFCPCHPSGNVPPYNRESGNRKPNPGMILYCVAYFDIQDAVFIGDRPEDEEAARRAGVQFEWADDFFER